ncbi:PREDICTED: uncharacterized protein LOC108369057 [Rhagoletis zephyria]|uniref:uncharacterized protein LOC108369057 n=1 Tax=Rhagoletis zephyria TaxID=28612 RepID=UPI00081134D7|nr:PREDICTED: uncharacterized protein LOC108369057 [Rhagoletis zephyria]
MQDLWKQLAEELNSSRGPTRSAAKWKETLGVWKSQLRTRARRLKMSQRLTGGGPSCKPMSDFEEKALATFGSAAVDGVKTIQSFGLTYSLEPLSVEGPISPESTSSLDSPQPPCSPLLIPLKLVEPSSPGQPPSPGQRLSTEISANPAPSPCSSLSLENQDARTSRLSRGERSKLISTLIANISKRNAAEDEKQRIENERREEHREMTQTIQGLTNTVAELVNVLNQNRSQ